MEQELTSAQMRVFTSILSSLHSARKKQVIVIEGLRGIGKSFLLARLEGEISGKASIVDCQNVYYRWERMRQSPIHIITTHTIGQHYSDETLYERIGKRYQEWDFRVFPLAGMSFQEAMSYAEILRGKTRGSLSLENTVAYSLGIPFLLSHLVREGMTEDIAAEVLARYLHESFRSGCALPAFKSEVRAYTKIEIPEYALMKIRRIGEEFQTCKIYSELFYLFRRQEESDTGSGDDESPLFVAPESEAIYDEMLRDGSTAFIDILAPHIAQADFMRILQTFGCYGKEDFSLIQSSAQVQRFGAEIRKVVFWYRNEGGGVWACESEYAATRPVQWLLAFTEKIADQYPFLRTEGKACFYFHKHEHRGMTYASAIFGWMVESFLQQRGIPYMCRNITYGAIYAYNPQQRRIEIITRESSLVGQLR